MDDSLCLSSYIFRHYNSLAGRWCTRDPYVERECYVFSGNEPICDIDLLGLSSFADKGETFTNISDVVLTPTRLEIAFTRTTHKTSINCECRSGEYYLTVDIDMSVVTYIQYESDRRWSDDSYGGIIRDPRVKQKWNSFWFFKKSRRIDLVKEHEKRHRLHAKANFDAILPILDAFKDMPFIDKNWCEEIGRDVSHDALKKFYELEKISGAQVEAGVL